MGPKILAPAILLLLAGPVWGQRLVTTIDPTELDENLRFDINTVPVRPGVVEISPVLAAGGTGRTVDLNFAPNLVFTPDSERAYLAFPGFAVPNTAGEPSNKVLAFHPKTGEILDLIEVANNPVQLALSPDGTRIAAVCLLLERNQKAEKGRPRGERVAAVALIDVATHDVEILDLGGVGIGWANNPVFSADGSTLYLASTGSDELLRIDVERLEEILPRLRLGQGIGGCEPGEPCVQPASITPAPDLSYLAVVLTQENLERGVHPDAIAIVDLEDFVITRRLFPTTGPTAENPAFQAFHDFTSTTMFSISPDGKWGLIADQAFSRVNQVPELVTDRAWLVDLETGEFEVFFVGGIPAGTYWSPTQEFLVVSALELHFIDPVLKEVRHVSPLRSDFRPRSRPAFTPDGKRMYIAAPISDSIIPLELETSEIPRFVEVGGPLCLADVGEGEDCPQGSLISSAPLELGVTPDGEVLVSVNFNANTIDLIRDTTHLAIHRALSSEDFFTGVALTNVSEEDANLIVTGLSNTGIVFADDPSTEDVVEFVNPREITLPAGHQLARTSDELILSSEEGRVEGWFDIDSDRPELKAFFLTGDLALKRLDGAVAAPRTSQRVILPEVRVTDGMVTEITVLNPNRQSARFSMDLVSHEGEVLGTFNRDLPSRGLFTGLVRDPDPDDGANVGIFPESFFEDFEDGYLVVTTPTGVMAYQRYFDVERMSSVNGLPVSDRDERATTFYLPQFALFQGADTFLKLINSHPKPVEDDEQGEGDNGQGDNEEGGTDPEEEAEARRLTVDLRVLGNDGFDLAAPVTLRLEAGQSVRQSVADLFGLNDPGDVVGGWILVEVDKEGLVGSAELRLFAGRAMTTVPLQDRTSTDLVFSHVAQGLGLSTGLALINPGASTANVAIEVFFEDGELNQSVEFALPAGARDAQLLNEYFADFGEQVGGYIRVTSDQNLAGLELFFADDLEYVSAVVAQ
jgi:DNA-binding beta-propeller fold protein YncE